MTSGDSKYSRSGTCFLQYIADPDYNFYIFYFAVIYTLLLGQLGSAHWYIRFVLVLVNENSRFRYSAMHLLLVHFLAHSVSASRNRALSHSDPFPAISCHWEKLSRDDEECKH